MAFNKKLTAFTLTIASTLLLAACGGDADTADSSTDESVASSEVASSEVVADGLQDGTYKLVEKNLDKNGWRIEFSITVADGKITESNFDSFNADGVSKMDDEEYQTNMFDKVGTGPQQFIPELNEQLVAKQDASEIEVVSGATHATDSFKTYAQQLIDAAKEGNTETIEIDNKAE